MSCSAAIAIAATTSLGCFGANKVCSSLHPPPPPPPGPPPATAGATLVLGLHSTAASCCGLPLPRARGASALQAALGLWRDVLLGDDDEGKDEEQDEQQQEEEEPEQRQERQEEEHLLFAEDAGKEEHHGHAAAELLDGIANLRKNQVVRIPRMIKLWAKAGNELSKETLVYLITRLRKRGCYSHALQIADWMDIYRIFPRDAEDHITRLELAGRCGAVKKAERIFCKLEAEVRMTERAHIALLLAYACSKKLGKAEELYGELKSSRMISSARAFGLMAMLYRKRKLEHRVLELLQDANSMHIELDIPFNNSLLVAKCKAEGIEQAEALFRDMVTSSSFSQQQQHRFMTYITMAGCYVSAGLPDRATVVLQRAEQELDAAAAEAGAAAAAAASAAVPAGESSSIGWNRRNRRRLNTLLISMYSSANNRCGVQRAWQRLQRFAEEAGEEGPRQADYYTLINAWRKLGDIEVAEAALRDAEAKCWEKLKYSPVFSAMMYAYSSAGMLDRARALANRMEEQLSIRMDKWCYHHLLHAHCKAGQLDRAAWLLRRASAAAQAAAPSQAASAPQAAAAAQSAGSNSNSNSSSSSSSSSSWWEQGRLRPVSWSLWVLLDAYGEAGDVEGAERALQGWKACGYKLHTLLYNRLLRAYLVAARPAGSFVQRMLDDRVRPDEETGQLYDALQSRLRHPSSSLLSSSSSSSR